MKAPDLGQAEGTTLLLAGGLALLAVWYIVSRGPAVVSGALSGNNALTQNAKNADGTPQTAYVGAGPAGTVGAAANAASGGWLSTFGDWLGGKAYDVTHSDPMANVATTKGVMDYGNTGNEGEGGW